MLELLEVVEVRQGRGAFVVSSNVRPSGRLLRHWLSAHRGEVLSPLEVRRRSRQLPPRACRRWECAHRRTWRVWAEPTSRCLSTKT